MRMWSPVREWVKRKEYIGWRAVENRSGVGIYLPVLAFDNPDAHEIMPF